jgi:hypothetical protein
VTEHHYKRFEDTFWGSFLKLWPVIIAIVTLVFAVGKSTSTINQMEDQLEANDSRDAHQEQRIVSMEEGKRNIEKRLDRIEDKLDKILRAVR